MEISYHPHPNLEADIIFVTKEEWVSELTIVLGDLADGLPGDGSKIAWDKVNTIQVLHVIMFGGIIKTPDQGCISRTHTRSSIKNDSARIACA
jgi:hypothetical protein